jgi:sulfate transport system permease protein
VIPVKTSAPRLASRRRGPLPGFGLAMGITLLYLSLLVLFPLVTLFLRSAQLGPGEIWAILSEPRTLAAYRLSLLAALAAALINAVFGLLLAWVLERYPFPGRRLVDGLVDLPFALPTAVAGISLATVYAPSGWLGRLLSPLGIEVAYQPLGVVVALVFVGLPFVVRTVQPVLRDLDPQLEEAAATLGAGRLRSFLHVVTPELLPALLAGTVLALARGLGEYGSVIFIAGNLPGRSEITPLLVMIQLEQYDYPAATAIAAGFLLVSFALLLLINLLSHRAGRGLLAPAEAS